MGTHAGPRPPPHGGSARHGEPDPSLVVAPVPGPPDAGGQPSPAS